MQWLRGELGANIDVCVAKQFLRVQYVGPERHHRPSSRGLELRFRKWFQRARTAAVAGSRPLRERVGRAGAQHHHRRRRFRFRASGGRSASSRAKHSLNWPQSVRVRRRIVKIFLNSNLNHLCMYVRN